MNKIFKFIINNPILLVLLLLIFVFSFIKEQFISYENITNILRQTSMLGFVAIGMAFVIIAGGIDLSVGSTMAMSSVIVATVAKLYPPIIGMNLAIIIGILIGFSNGLMVVKLKFQPIIATLITMATIRGLAMKISDSRPIFGSIPEEFFLLSDGFIFGIPIPAILFLLAAAISIFFLNLTNTGREIYQVGGNPEAARLAGVNVDKIKIITYTISGFMSSFAGLILAARMQSGEAVRTGIGWELDAIAATAIGGISLMGGTGTIFGALCGTYIIGMMTNIFNLIGMNPYWQRIVIGLLILLAVTSYGKIFKKVIKKK